MAKISIVFLAVFLFVQIAVCEEETETTTKTIFDSIKQGIENGMTEENINKFKDNFKNLADSFMELGTKVGSNLKNFVIKPEGENTEGTNAEAA